MYHWEEKDGIIALVVLPTGEHIRAMVNVDAYSKEAKFPLGTKVFIGNRVFHYMYKQKNPQDCVIDR